LIVINFNIPAVQADGNLAKLLQFSDKVKFMVLIFINDFVDINHVFN
jgi:hypothetical protein